MSINNHIAPTSNVLLPHGGNLKPFEDGATLFKDMKIKGCVSRININLFIGKEFNYLTILKETDRQYFKAGYWVRMVLCKCRCGNIKSYQLNAVKNNHTKSCGCLHATLASARAKIQNRTHGLSHTNEYTIWADIKRRCFDVNTENYKNYGGRGIKICERWHDFNNFLSDMGYRPSKKHSLERINNNGNYEPSNCKWATQKEQMRNTRRTRFITFNGETMCIMAWAEKFNINASTLYDRINRKLPIERCLNHKRLHKSDTKFRKLSFAKGEIEK